MVETSDCVETVNKHDAGQHCKCFERTGVCCWCGREDKEKIKTAYLDNIKHVLSRSYKKYPEETDEIIKQVTNSRGA